MQSITDTEDKKENLSNTMFVTFNIDNETYGLDVSCVQEIIGIIPIAHIPNSAEYLKGVINLRGKVVPVIDVRIKFRMTERKYDATTVILIVELKGNSIGLIVDSVSDVIDIPASAMHDYSGADMKIKSSSIRSIASQNDNLILILDLEKMIDDETLLSGEFGQE